MDWQALRREEFSDPEVARHLLAACLRAGNLCLVLGSGVSKAIELPLWHELVRMCCEIAEVEHNALSEEASSSQLMELMDEVDRLYADKRKDFLALVSRSLYKDVGYAKDIIKKPMLIALGAMLMGSRRGSVTDVITLNFDDVLEWYLALHGFKTQVIVDLPKAFHDCDVRLYHVHGFLPKNVGQHAPGKFLVLSHRSFIERIANPMDPWNDFLRNLFRTRLPVMVGTRGTDLDLQVVFKQVEDGHKGVRGFWIGTAAASSGKLKDMGLIPVELEEPHQIPDYLLSICQLASDSEIPSPITKEGTP